MMFDNNNDNSSTVQLCPSLLRLTPRRGGTDGFRDGLHENWPIIAQWDFLVAIHAILKSLVSDLR